MSKIIVLKGNQIISEFTFIIFNELKQIYPDIEYQDKYDPKNKDILHFIISPHDEEDNGIPPKYIIYNLEPINSRMNNKKYIDKIKNATQVWEYSQANMERIALINKNVIYQPFLYSPYMKQLYNTVDVHNAKKDIDVLFYGLMSQRRKRIIEELKQRNINVYCPNYPEHKPVWGQEKYDLINRSKIVINIHYHENKKDQTNDLLRIMFLLANQVCVIQEETIDKDIDDKLEDIIVPYEKIVLKCQELLSNQEKLKQHSEKMYETVKTKMRFNFLNLLKNKYENQKVVLMAPGPSLNNFNVTTIPKKYYKSGVNGVIIHEECQDLDLYFWSGDLNTLIHRTPSEKPIRENLPKLKQSCIKFTNTTINESFKHPQYRLEYGVDISETQINEDEAKQLGFLTYNINFGIDHEDPNHTWHIDPIMNGFDGVSISLASCQILIYLGFTEIILVGCDCTTKHSYEHLIEQDKCDWQLNQLVERWIRFKNYVKQYFPHVHIKVINPIGLKNVFEETKF